HRDKDGDNYICANYGPANQEEQKEVSSTLSEKEHTRDKRQMLREGWGTESQEKLKNTTVFVGGAGGGASPTVMALALAGFGKIIICDFDEVELSNLNRQFLHDPSRIGMNKALSAQMTVNTINPHIEVVPITEKLTSENVAQLVGDAAVIFDMFDGPASKFVLSRYASEKNIPHIISSMTDISSYTAVFHTPFTPCYHCVLDKKKLDELTAGMQSVSDTYQKQALAVVASSLMVSSGFAVNEAIKIVLGLRNPAYNKFLFFNQGGTDEIADSFGFKSMTTLFSDFFKKTCKEQGFDWETGWRGNFLEELDISVSPDCPICGKRSKDEENVAPPANNSTKKFSLADLKDYLAQELPEYMIPTYFVPLENMPLTPNGKIDKKALPEPDLSVQGDVIGPRNQLEEQLTSIWSDVLGRDKKTISMDADFFQMGGHSLKVTMLVEKIQSELKRDVPLSDIFKTPTIEKMTGLIAGKDSAASPKQADAQPVPPAALPGDQRAALPTPRGGALGTPMPVDPERKPGIVERGIPGEALEDENLVLLRKGEGKYNLFLMHAGGGEVTGYGEFCSRLNEQFNCWGLRAGHLENSTPVANTVEQIAAKYIRKMKIVQPQGPYFFKGWCFGGTIAFEMVRQLEANGEEIAFFSLVNSIPPRRRPGRFHEGITKFSLQSEKEYVSQFMSESIIEEVLTGVDDLADLWPTIIRYMDSIDYDPADIRKLIPDFMRDAILNFNELDCDKLIYYMNVVRSHLAARELYVPQTKVKKKSSFFTVTFGEIPDRDRWELYLEKDSTYLPVNGDHFSILRRPEVEDYAAAFDKLMMQHVDNG
ncbi:MAG: hypothetical protein GY765_02705, partial [bacterium]|nr:hypothetical protein [bacterium]